MAALQTPWYNKTVEALQLSGKGERTQQAYARAVRMLIEFHGKERTIADADDAEAPSSAPTTPVFPVCRKTTDASGQNTYGLKKRS